MIYPLSLATALIATGLLLILAGIIALAKPAGAQAWLRAFPRSRGWGTALIILAAAWAWILVKTIDLGEFSNWRGRVLFFIPIAAFLAWSYVEELLAARALGMVALLAAEPLLESAFLRPEATRLFLVTPVYVLIVAGMFWIGTPYVLRDQIAWMTKSEGRWRAAAFAILIYGVLLVSLVLTLHRSS